MAASFLTIMVSDRRGRTAEAGAAPLASGAVVRVADSDRQSRLVNASSSSGMARSRAASTGVAPPPFVDVVEVEAQSGQSG